MSNNSWFVTDNDVSRFSSGTTKQNYTKICLNQDSIEKNSILEPNRPGSVCETINCDTEVINIFGNLNPPKKNSVKRPSKLMFINKQCETPLLLNFECNMPARSYLKSNAVLKPCIMDNIIHCSNTQNKQSLDHEKLNSYVEQNSQTLVPMVSTVQNENQQLPVFKIFNANQSYSTTFRLPDQSQYSFNNNIQENDSYFSQILPNSIERQESVIKYCKPTQENHEIINTSIKDPRLKKHSKNKYENGFINFEGLKQIKYNKKTYLNENLEKINKKLQNMNSSYRFGVSNNSDRTNNINEHNVERIEKPLVNHIKYNNSQNDLKTETHVHFNKVLKHVNTEQDQNIKCREVSAVIDLTDDIYITTEDDYNALKNDCERKKELKASFDEIKLKHVIENIIDNLNDKNISDSSCTTRMISQKKTEMIITHNLNDQTKNYADPVNKNIIVSENSSFNKTQQISGDNISRLIEKNRNSERIRSIENLTTKFIKKKHTDFRCGRNFTTDVSENPDVDTEMIITELENSKCMSKVNVSKDEDKFDQCSEISEKLNDKEYSVIKKHKKSKKSKKSKKLKKSKNNKNKNKSLERNQSKDNDKFSKMYENKYSSKTDSKVIKIVSEFENTNSDLITSSAESSDEQANNKKMAKKLVRKTMKTNKNKIKNEPNKITQLENETVDINKKLVEYASKLKKNNECGLDSIKAVFNKPCFKVKPNTNTLTENVVSSMNVAKKTHNTHDKLSITERNLNETTTTKSNFTDSTYRYKKHKASINLKKHTNDTIELNDKMDVLNVPGLQSSITSKKIKSKSYESTDAIKPLDSNHGNNNFIDCRAKNVNTKISYDRKSNYQLNKNKHLLRNNKINEPRLPKYLKSLEINLTKFNVKPIADVFPDEKSVKRDIVKVSLKPNTVQLLPNSEHPVKEIITDAVKKEPTIKCSEQISNENKSLTLKDTTVDKTRSNKLFEDVNILPIDCFIDNGKADENQDTEINESDVAAQLSNDNCLPNDVQPVSKHFEMDDFFNIIKINDSLFRINLHNEDDIFNYIRLYSRQTQTSWRVLKSYRSKKYDIWKIFGCLHNSLHNFLKINLKKRKCQSVIDIRIISSKEKSVDPHLKNGLPAIVKIKNHHNHLVCKVDEVPLLRSLTDNNVKQPFKNDFTEPEKTEKILQDCNIGIQPNLSQPVVDTRNSLDNAVDIIETNNINTSIQSTDHISFSKWEDIEILCDIVESKKDVRLKPGQHIVNNVVLVDSTSYHFVNTSYRKEYFRILKDILSDDVKSKWIYDKMTTLGNQISLYKCSGKNCQEMFRNRMFFRSHLKNHYDPNGLESASQFFQCMYCFKKFDTKNINVFTNHITDNYTFCKYFCRYCLYRAYTASHVLIHEYVFHNNQKPSILKIKNFRGERKEVAKAIDFKKFVRRYVCNIGCCTFFSYINSDFLSHLRLEHEHCDQFSCDLCAKNNDNGFVSFKPKSFVKHFNMHSINTYQCIFCLFGVGYIEIMIIHLAMEHFEYEPLCLERSLKNDVYDKKKIQNLKILNIKKYVSDEIIEVVNPNLTKNLSIKVCPTKEMYDTHQMDPDNTFKNTKIDETDNSARLLSKIFKKIAQSSRNTLTPAIDIKKNEIKLSDEVKQNVPRDAQRIQNVKASVVNDKKKPSELSNDDLKNNLELEKNIEIQIRRNSSEIHSSKEPIDQSKKDVNEKLDNQSETLNKLISSKTIDKVTPDGFSYEDHLNNCLIKSSKECTFCLPQSNSSFKVVELPKLLRLNRFTCTFCNLELPSSDIVKRHVRKEHHISNLEFVPVDINATDIEKDRFLVCQDKSSKTKKQFNDCTILTESCDSTTAIHKKRSNDCIILTEDCDSTTTIHKKRFKVDNKHNDSQLTTLPNTLNTSEQHTTRRSRVESKEHKILKRKHSSESCNKTSNKKTPNTYKSNDTILSATITKYFSPENIDSIPETVYFLKPMRCLLCDYQTKVRFNLVAHIKKHRIKPDESMTENISQSIPCNPKSVFTSMNIISSPTSSLDAQQNEKIKSDNMNKNLQIATSNTTVPSFQQDTSFYDHPQFIPKKKRFKCSFYRCNFIGLNMKILKTHLLKNHQNVWFYICPHCKPIQIRLTSVYNLRLHLNYHAEDLYICQYCSFIHYNHEKIEAHQKRKHFSQIEGENKFNIVAIRGQAPIKNFIPLDQKIPEWICKLCDSSVNYTITEIAEHLLKVHNISNMFKCSVCLYDHSDYNVFEKHFKLNHPLLPVKYLKVNIDKVSSDKELQSPNKQINVDEHVTRTQCNMLNVSEALDSVVKSTIIIPSSKEILTTTCSISTKSIDASEVQETILSNPTEYPNDYMTLIQSMAKYVCPVCNVFITEEEQSIREHLLKEINCKLWKCLECFAISDSLKEMKSHIIKHRLEKRNYEKIESFNKSSWINRIIEHQNILIEYVLLRKFNQKTNFANRNGFKHGNDQSK